MKTGWVFVFNGKDIVVDWEYGVCLDFNKAFEKLCEINTILMDIKTLTYLIYEENYCLKSIEEFCKNKCLTGEPYRQLYALQEIEIFE